MCFYELFSWVFVPAFINCTHWKELWSAGIKNPLKDKAVDYSYHQSRYSYQHTKYCVEIACWQNCTLKGGYLQVTLNSPGERQPHIMLGVGKMLN